MKTIKLLSLCTLLSLAWIACKNEATTETEASEEVAAESKFIASQVELEAHCNKLSMAVSQKIADLEAKLSMTDDPGATKYMKEQLEIFKTIDQRLAEVVKKVGGSTEEELEAVNEEVQSISKEVKAALENVISPTAGPGQLTN